MHIVLISIVIAILLYVGYRFYQMWPWYLELNPSYKAAKASGNYVPFYKVFFAFMGVMFTLLKTPDSRILVLRGKFDKMVMAMADPKFGEDLQATIDKLDLYNESVFIPRLIVWFDAMMKEYDFKKHIGEIYMTLLRTIQMDESNDLDKELKDVLYDKIGKAEYERLLTYPVTLNDHYLLQACRSFLMELRREYKQELHGDYDLIRNMIVGALVDRDKMTSRINADVMDVYDDLMASKEEQVNRYRDEILIQVIFECFHRLKKVYKLEYGDIYLYLLSFMVNVIGRKDIGLNADQMAYLRRKTRYIPQPDTKIYAECEIFFTVLMNGFDESRHGDRNAVDRMTFETLTNRESLAKLLGPEVIKGYDKMTT